MDRNITRAVARGIVASVLIGLPNASALAQAPVPPAARAPADPAIETARAAFEALSEAERKAIQDALVWTGDYAGLVDGGFGRGTFEAIAAYQRRTRQAPNGILAQKARGELASAAREAREAAGFSLVDDSRSGARIGMPERILLPKGANTVGGSRWQSADEKVTLDTRSAPAADGGLQALYDRNLAIQTPGRQVTYKVIRPDFFVIAGETPTGKFYSRYAFSGGIIRAFSIGYDKTMAKDIDRFVVAIANTFDPFPAAPASVVPPAVASPALPNRPQPEAGAAGRLVGTGLVIAPRQVVSTAMAGDCAELRVAGAKPVQVRTDQGLTRMELDADRKAPAMRPAPASSGAGAPLLVLAYRAQGAQTELVAVPAVGEDGGSLSAPLQTGALGAPVVDLTGALRGLVRDDPDARRMIAGIVPPARYRIEAGLLAGLKANGEKADDARTRTTADLVAALRDSIVPITCVR